MKHTRSGLMRFFAAFFALLIVFTAVPASVARTEAAAKPKLKAKVNVKVGKTKAIAINKKGFTIISVKVESDDEDIVTVAANKKKVKVTGVSIGAADINTTIKAEKDGMESTFTYITAVTVKAQAMNTAPAATTPSNTTPKVTTPAVTTPAANAPVTATPVNTTPATPVNTAPAATTATVNTQAELDAALADSSIKTVTIGQGATSLVINSAVYADKSLVVDAPNASITNLATFKSVEVRNISANTWTERASGNNFTITSAQPVRFIAPANYNIASIRFTGNASGTSNVIINGGVVGEIAVEARSNVNVSAIGTATVTKIGVTAAANVGVNCADNAVIGTVETTDIGSTLTIGSTSKARISDIKLTHATNGNVRTNLNVTSAQTSAISTIEASSAYANLVITENDSSTISTLRIRESATATLYGSSKNQTYLDLNSANQSTRVTANTSALRIELGYNMIPETVISNVSTSNLSVTYYTSSGSRTTTTISAKNMSRINNALVVTKNSNYTNQIVAAFATAVNGLNVSNFRLYAANGMYITSAVTTDNGKTYLLTLNSSMIAGEKYTVEVVGLDPNVYYNSSLSASFSTESSSIRLNKTVLTVTDAQIGSSERLTAQVLPDDGLSRIPSWYSSDVSVVSVDNNGVVTYRGLGNATITAYYGNISASCKVTVTSTTKSNPYLLVRDRETRNVIDNVVVTKLGGSKEFSFTVEDIGSAYITDWQVTSSNYNVTTQDIRDVAGNYFRVASTLRDGVTSVITLTVTLSNGQKLVKNIQFNADMAGEA